jgi:hypothetical protein
MKKSLADRSSLLAIVGLDSFASCSVPSILGVV